MEMQVSCKEGGKEQTGNYTGLLDIWGSICGTGIEVCHHHSQISLGPTQPSVQGVLGALFPEER
jgi:hypothetical protein